MAADQTLGDLARILVPTDFSAGSERAWTEARRLASRLGAELVLVHVLVETPLYSEGSFNVKQTSRSAACGAPRCVTCSS